MIFNSKLIFNLQIIEICENLTQMDHGGLTVVLNNNTELPTFKRINEICSKILR